MSYNPNEPQLFSKDRDMMLRVMNILWDWCLIHENEGKGTYNAPNGVVSNACAEWYREHADRVGTDII